MFKTSPGKTRGRALGAALVVLMVAGCGSAVATPAQSTGPANSTAPTNSAWPTYLASPIDFGSPADLATPTDYASPTPADLLTPSPGSTTAPAGYPIAMGKAALLPAAQDGGKLAGTEITDFGFDLLRRLDAKGNLCASPASIALALAMVRPGARGQTAAEMDKVLHSFGTPSQAREIVALLNAFEQANAYDDDAWYVSHPDAGPNATPDHTGLDPIAELDVSNAVFSQKGMKLQQAYLDALSSGFGAGIGQLDYATDPEAARAVINKWASDRTKGRIPAVLQSGDVDTLTRIMLANAIYMKAAWENPFDPAKTKPLPFTTASGTKVTVPTMANQLLEPYSHGAGYRAVSLSLGTTEMTLIVPDNMSSFVSSLSAAKLAAMDKASGTYLVNLTMPRFSAETRVDLVSILAAMGMPTAFSGKADLSGITTEQKLSLYTVIHQANIDVVEEGTTASAVTMVGGKGGIGGNPPPAVTFNINQPFLYLIREWSTGTVLFMGRIDDPSTKS
jgi:serpin B